jgi:hypothetical protein
MRTVLKTTALVVGLSVVCALAPTSYARPAPTRERVQAELSRVGQEVWHARLTSDLNAQMYQAWIGAKRHTTKVTTLRQ